MGSVSEMGPARAVIGVWLLLMGTISAATAENVESRTRELEGRVRELEQKLERQSAAIEEKTTTLAEEIEQSRLRSFIPERSELKSEYGLGPAASSVYQVKNGLSLAAYSELNFRAFVADEGTRRNETDALRLVTYIGYKFNDYILFNSEIEFEHGTTEEIGGVDGDDEGSVSAEFAHIDFLFDRAVNARIGLVLIPMGFINEVHEPPYYHGVVRPQVEQTIIPTTWRENGLGVFGEFDAGGKVEYRSYLVNGLRAKRFSDSGIRDGRQKGNRALFEDIAWTSRLDYSPEVIPGFLLGGSFWLGNSGQDDTFAGQSPSVGTTILEAHAQYRYEQLELRALGAWTDIDDTELLSAELGKTIGERQYGWYVEAAYDVLPHIVPGTTHRLSPFVRFESFDTHADVAPGLVENESLDKQVYTAGLSYKPVDNVVVKLDYRNFDTDGPAKTPDEVAVGVGVAF